MISYNTIWAIVASIRGAYFGLKALVSEIRKSSAQFDALVKRININPGFPVANPTHPFWLENPPFPKLIDIQSTVLETTADIVIIGSGITGASVARTLLRQCARLGITKRIVMLEARDVTSGATGRNGGHIKVSPYEAFSLLRPKYGTERARAIIEFQLRHLPILVDLAKAKGWDSAEARYVETVDLFVDGKTWGKSKKMVEELRIGMPETAKDIRIWEAEEARKVCLLAQLTSAVPFSDKDSQEFKTGNHVLGALSYSSGALFPYRLVTSVLSDLLATYPKTFSIETNTPVDAILTDSVPNRPFVIQTRRGHISTSHVIHATNSHSAGLIPGLVGKIFPVRGQMTAQRPGKNFPQHGGTRSWAFIDDRGFEYVIQRPESAGSEEGGSEIMLGGALFYAGMDEIGVQTDAELNYYAGSHLGGVLPMVFGPEYWGTDHPEGRVKSMWTGIMGYTIDMLPFVGKLESTITKRQAPEVITPQGISKNNMPDPAEWIAAGFNGEGMVNAWLCGVAVAMQVLGLEGLHVDGEPGVPSGKVSDWYPEEYAISTDRLSRATITELATLL